MQIQASYSVWRRIKIKLTKAAQAAKRIWDGATKLVVVQVKFFCKCTTMENLQESKQEH
jgi:hypothetical protein